jgi:hypothetical protein
MENQNVSPMPAAMRWGAILGAVGIATSTINFMVGGFSPENQDSVFSKLIQYGMYALIILVLVLAMQQHRDKELGGYMTYGRGLGLGTLIGLFYGIIAALCAFVIFRFFMPADFADKALDMARDKMLERNPSMTDDQVETGLGMARKFMNPPFMALVVFVGGAFICFFFSLIISAFVKKNNPNELI